MKVTRDNNMLMTSLLPSTYDMITILVKDADLVPRLW